MISNSRDIYRGEVISDDKGSVCVKFGNLRFRGDMGRNVRECKVQNKPPGTFDIRNNSTNIFAIITSYFP